MTRIFEKERYLLKIYYISVPAKSTHLLKENTVLKKSELFRLQKIVTA